MVYNLDLTNLDYYYNKEEQALLQFSTRSETFILKPGNFMLYKTSQNFFHSHSWTEQSKEDRETSSLDKDLASLEVF